ncbi:unnamed protein product [Ixodes hexagonus]
MEAGLVHQKVKFMNQALWDRIQRLPGAARFIRSFDSLKSHRKQPSYRELVRSLIEGAVHRDEAPIAEEETPLDSEHGPVAQCELLYDSRPSVLSAITGLLNKTAPQVYQGPRLWEIGHLAVRGVDFERRLNDYIRDAFFVEPKGSGRKPRKRMQEKESNRKRKKRQYVETQKFRRRQADCARSILDGEQTAEVVDVEAFLSEWEEIMTGPVLPPPSVPPQQQGASISFSRYRRRRLSRLPCPSIRLLDLTVSRLDNFGLSLLSLSAFS